MDDYKSSVRHFLDPDVPGEKVRTILAAIYTDPHQWSTRPCATCAKVTRLAGAPFGCDRFRAERASSGKESAL